MPSGSYWTTCSVTMADDVIRSELVASGLPELLVDELIEAFSEVRRNHYLGDHRLAAVEGGRFCEAAYRVLEHTTYQCSTPLGSQLDADKLSRRLASEPAGMVTDSIRLHIPRTMRVIYDIRSHRDAVHLGDGIDPNIQDSSLVIACINWVMAEFIRLYHGADADMAADLINQLVARTVPVVQDFDGVPRVLRNLRAGDTCLLLLYRFAPEPMMFEDLRSGLKQNMRSNLSRTLQGLEDRNYIHQADERIWITRVGERRVEQERLADEI